MKPKLSVIIPIGPGRRIEAISSLEKQTEKVEIIIEKGTNPSKNRNEGVKKAKAEIVAFVDAHSILPETWAEKIIAFFEKYKQIDIVGGPQLTPENETRIGRISGYALSSPFGASDSSIRYKSTKIIWNANEKFLTSANLASRKSVFEKVQFDESIYPGEDPKFISDSKLQGFKVSYVPDIFSYHRRRGTIGDFARQIFKYGITRPQKESLFQTLKTPSFLVPPAFLIYLTIFPILYLINILFLIPIILYLILSLIFSLYSAISNKDIISVFILPFIFFTIHVSYGLGFIWGTISK